jgi:AraC family transcriptional regulator
MHRDFERTRDPDSGTAGPLGSPSVRAFQQVLGTARSAYRGSDFTVCRWDARELGEYDLPATSELVVNLHTGGGPVRSRLEDGWTRGMGAGHVHVMPPSVPTRWRAGRELSFISIHFPVERIRQLADDDRQSRRWLQDLQLRVGLDDPLIAAAATALSRDLDQPAEPGMLFANHLADTILLQALRTRTGPDAEMRVLAQGGLSPRQSRIIREKIEESLCVGTTLDELAATLGLSRAHFARAFKASMGVPPHRYVTQRRVERAKLLLSTTTQSLADLALALGFSSQSHLTEQFRRTTGSTPLRYRKEFRAR